MCAINDNLTLDDTLVLDDTLSLDAVDWPHDAPLDRAHGQLSFLSPSETPPAVMHLDAPCPYCGISGCSASQGASGDASEHGDSGDASEQGASGDASEQGASGDAFEQGASGDTMGSTTNLVLRPFLSREIQDFMHQQWMAFIDELLAEARMASPALARGQPEE